MSIKITIPNSSSDVLTFGSGNTPVAAQIAGIDSGSSNGQLALYTTASGTSTERMRIDSSGNVGVGTASPGDKLVVSATSAGSVVTLARLLNAGTTTGTASRLLFTNNTDGSGGAVSAAISHIAENTSGAGALAFYTPTTGSPVERMRIDSSGNVQVGTTSNPNAVLLRLNATNAANTCRAIQTVADVTTSVNAVFFSNPNGNVGSIGVSGSATTFNTSSDYRLKENIAPMTGALSKVALLKPVTYKWKVDGSDGQGFIAHELAEVEAGCVTGEKDGIDADGNPVYQGIDTSFLVATLTAAIQEQQAIIQTLTDRITALENK